jgi:tRNA (guanine-N7-)-methyltransferase
VEEGTTIDLERIFPERKASSRNRLRHGNDDCHDRRSSPEIGYLGVEVHTRCRQTSLGNRKEGNLESGIVHDDAIPLLSSGYRIEARRIHIFFRILGLRKSIINAGSFPRIRENPRLRLKVGGYLYLVTDWEDYAIQMLEVLNRIPDL